MLFQNGKYRFASIGLRAKLDMVTLVLGNRQLFYGDHHFIIGPFLE